ncbi:MAG: hypothetical protein FWF23_03885 [Alphaproteobacteria bacterium]|nr:hypothetical protein [Alphaproteobacteria bacterium]MCL2505194.1 hypothetical protein [Alphaproteobacteria bacterium]
MIRKSVLCIFVLGTLCSCIPGNQQPDSYVGKDGEVTLIENSKESCVRSCNWSNSNCMDTFSAAENSGLSSSRNIGVGARAECRTSLRRCLDSCK